MIRHILLMTGKRECTDDCSGRGECHNGTCVCEIRFAGDFCDGPNLPYHAGIGGVFLVIALICAIQLLMCIASEYQRLKTPTFLKACQITTQKVLYFITFLASLLRGAYFTSPSNFKHGWSSSLISAYYPLLMSGSSLIVCFWAEVFHLPGIQLEKPHFLSKSFLGFLTFNIINYSLLLAEVLTSQFAPSSNHQLYYSNIFNGCYGVLLFIVVIFFLIYGVEVYFKLRGGFIKSCMQLSNIEGEHFNTQEIQPIINNSQVHQSRVGLLSHAFMLIIIVGFLFSETLSEFWKSKVPIKSRNWHDVLFRVVEIGVAVWFPAVLWNCISPSELWILNPKKLLAKFDQTPWEEKIDQTENCNAETETFMHTQECWICYDVDKTESLIQPCACIGDVSSVHHECLRRWLIESSSSSSEALKCKVCNQLYNVHETKKLNWEKGFTAYHWGSTAIIVTCLCISVAASWTIIQIFEDSYIRMLSASLAVLVIYICIKFLGQNTVKAYNRAKVGSLNIRDHVATISESVPEDIKASSNRLQQE